MVALRVEELTRLCGRIHLGRDRPEAVVGQHPLERLGGAPSEMGFASLQPGMGTIPRVGEPDELANIIVMVASDGASFLNGAVIPVDGGWTAQG